jgi:hypothetical protein
MQTGPDWMPARVGSAGGHAMADQSVPLSEALERFSEPTDWKELRSLEPYALTIFWLGEPETESDRLHSRYHRLKERLETEFLAKLTAGSLRASGLVWPIGLNAKRRAIPAARWHKLEPDFAASEATGGGLRIVEIRVQESQHTRVRSSHPSPADQHVLRGHASLAKLRTELRRWLQREAQSRGMSWQKKHYCSAARTRFGDRVTNNLFNEVWRSADLPEALRRPGLRKVADHLAGSSAPA